MGWFKKKPVVLEAIQYNGHNCLEIIRFMGGPWTNLELKNSDRPIIHTLEGELAANEGDWIIRGVKGEYYPCRSDIFEALYEVVP